MTFHQVIASCKFNLHHQGSLSPNEISVASFRLHCPGHGLCGPIVTTMRNRGGIAAFIRSRRNIECECLSILGSPASRFIVGGLPSIGREVSHGFSRWRIAPDRQQQSDALRRMGICANRAACWHSSICGTGDIIELRRCGAQ